VAGFCEHGSETTDSIKKGGYCLRGWVAVSFSRNILQQKENVNLSLCIFFFLLSTTQWRRTEGLEV